MLLKTGGATVVLFLGLVSPVLADQAECEIAVRALLNPHGENKTDVTINRFGTVKTVINGAEQFGYSLQTPEGSVYYDADKNPTSLSFSTGETFWSGDKGKTWNLVNPNSKEVMDAVFAGLKSEAEKATNISCDYGIDFEGRTVNHYIADHVIYNTGDKVHTEYWIDPGNGFVWRDLNHTTGSAEVVIDVRAEPAPDMALPPKPAI